MGCGLTSDTFSDAFTPASDVITITAAAFVTGLLDEKAFIILHSAIFPGGEFRGQLPLTAVPLPGALALFGSGLGVLGLVSWRRRRAA